MQGCEYTRIANQHNPAENHQRERRENSAYRPVLDTLWATPFHVSRLLV